MDDLLPYYERELAFLRNYSVDFAGRYPKIAGRLSLTGDVSEDPHVERMIQSFALMGARITKKIEDDYPELTEALLNVLYPHYLRPFPSCSIVHFDMEGTVVSKCATISRGTQLQSKSDAFCKFRTVYDVTVAPVRISSARFRAVAKVPHHVQLPAQGNAQISIEFELLSAEGSFSALGIDSVQIFTDGEPSFCAVLRDVLALKVCKAYVEPADSGKWVPLDGEPMQVAGFDSDEALIDWPARSHPAYRLLTELFAFPDKYGFFNCDLRHAGEVGGRRFTLHLILKDVSFDSTSARLLEGLSTKNLRMNCTPVVNLFKRHGTPAKQTHQKASYSVAVDRDPEKEKAATLEVHSIDSVTRTQNTTRGPLITEIHPFYSLHHGESTAQNGAYWIAQRDEELAQTNPSQALELSIVDPDFDPMTPDAATLSFSLTCSNGKAPAQLPYNTPNGDLDQPGGGLTQKISILRKPTLPLRFEHDRGEQWRLISHLSLNQQSLVEGGASAFREMLKLYDLQRSAISARHIEGVIELTHRPTTAWLPGKYFASVARGVEIRLVIDEDSFVGLGLHIFARVVDHFFGLYVHANSFTQLVLVSAHSGEEILRCQPRSGDSILV